MPSKSISVQILLNIVGAKMFLIVGLLSFSAAIGPAIVAGTTFHKLDNSGIHEYKHYLEFEFDRITNQQVIITFEVNQTFEAVSVSTGIGNLMMNWETGELEGVNEDEVITATLYWPDDARVESWEVHMGECHLSPEACAMEHGGNPFGREHAVINYGPIGEYILELTPGPGRDELPSAGHYRMAVFAYTEDKDWNLSSLREDDTWWYHADGSKTLVEDGGYIDQDGTDRVLFYWLPAGALLGLFGVVMLLIGRAKIKMGNEG